MENVSKKLPYKLISLAFSISFGIVGFILLLYYINKYCRSSIYMDQIRLIADNLENIYTGQFTFKDCFTTHSGHFSIGTYLILLYQARVLGFENNTLLIKLIPVCIFIIYISLTTYRVIRKDSSLKEMIINIIYSLTIAFILFSLYQFEIIFFSYGAIIFYGNALFIVALVLTIIYYNSPKRLWVLILGVLIGVGNIFLFGSGYDYAFIFAFEFVNIMGIIKYFKTNKKVTISFAIVALVYLMAFIFLLTLLIQSGSGASEDAIAISKDSFIFVFNAVASLFIPNYATYKSIYILFGVLFVIAAFGAIIIFFINKNIRKEIMPAALIAFSGMVYISVYGSRFSYGLTYGMASRYFTSYLYLLIGVIDIYASFFADVNIKSNKRAVSSILNVSKAIPSLALAFLTIFTQIKGIKDELVISPYRRELSEALVEYSLYYEYFDDETLLTLYQDNPESVRKCFSSLQKYELYVFNPNCDLVPNIGDSIMSTETTLGSYNEGGDNMFISKKAIFALKLEEAQDITIRIYNPASFPTNTFSISVNAEYVYNDIDIASNEIKDVDLSLKKGINTVMFDLAYDYVPKDIGLGDDVRNLAVIIKDITDLNI